MGEGENGVPQDVAHVHVEHPANCFPTDIFIELCKEDCFGFVGDCDAESQHAFGRNRILKIDCVA